MKWATGKVNAMWGTLSIIGPIFIGSLIKSEYLITGSEVDAYRMTFLVVGLTMVIAAITRTFLLSVNPSKGSGIIDSITQFKTLVKSKNFKTLMYLQIVGHFAGNIMYTFLALFILNKYNADEFQIGLILSGGSLAYVAASLLFSEMKTKYSQLIYAYLCTVAFPMAAALDAPYIVFIVTYLVIHIPIALIDIIVAAGIASRIGTKGRGGVYGIMNTIYGLASAPSAQLAGIMWTQCGISAPVILGGMIYCGVGTLLSISVSKMESADTSKNN